MKQNRREIELDFERNDDFFLYEQEFKGEHLVFMGLRSLIDVPKTQIMISELLKDAHLDRKGIVEKIERLGIQKERKEIFSSILDGKLIITLEKNKEFFIEVTPLPQLLTRSIEPPTNENSVQGPLSSFNEDINTNIGIIRKEMVSDKLYVKSFSIGKKQVRKISLIFYNTTANLPLISKIIKKMEGSDIDKLHNHQDVTKLLGISSWSLVSHYNTTENPQEATSAIEKGRIVLLIDRMPYALILPGSLWDMFAIENDRNFPFLLIVSIRTLRIIAGLIALITPGLYVALVSVNPEVLRIEMALSIANSREGVPYPALMETFLMLIVLELIIEASVRLPKSIGPTITMVGGIIIGQAAVEAQLVSNLLIIILAATTIANSAIVGVQNNISIRLLKYFVLVLASIFGVLGILFGIFFICAFYASITTLGVPYPVSNFIKG